MPGLSWAVYFALLAITPPLPPCVLGALCSRRCSARLPSAPRQASPTVRCEILWVLSALQPEREALCVPIRRRFPIHSLPVSLALLPLLSNVSVSTWNTCLCPEDISLLSPSWGCTCWRCPGTATRHPRASVGVGARMGATALETLP